MRSAMLGRVVSVGLSIGVMTGCAGSQAGAPPVAPQNPAMAGSSMVAPGTRPGSATTAFTVSGRKLLLNGAPFFIKGVDYGNNQIDAYADSNPLDDANQGIWQPDLTAMRAAGVNSVKVYNVTLKSFKPYEDIIGGYNKLRPYETGKIGKFLDAAWNGGNRPVYVVLSVFFGAANVLEPKYLNALKAVYNLMATEYASKPAVMGISIGSEINSKTYINQPIWWKGLNEISDSITKAYHADNVSNSDDDDGRRRPQHGARR